MSIVWATVASSATGRLESWRGVLAFGGYNGASCVIDRIYASMPQLVLGHMLPHSAVGLSNSGVRGVRHPEAKSF